MTDVADLPTRSLESSDPPPPPPPPPPPGTPPDEPHAVDIESSTPISREPTPPHFGPAPPPAASLAIGTFIGSYLIVDTLGEGGMGRVYQAFDRSLDRQVAIKVLLRELDPREQTRLVREARAMARVSHPNVVQVYEVGKHQGQAFIVMELLKGQTLRRWQRRDPRPDWRACVRAYQQAGAGLAAAHEQRLVHRDFKPSNALIDPRGRVRVLDFGLVRTTAEKSDDDDMSEAPTEPERPASHERPEVPLTKTGAIMGTLGYMPPEQMQGKQVGASGDQFSFCVSLYEAVYGARPFLGTDIDSLEASIRSRTFAPHPSAGKVPPPLHQILMRGLAPTPSQRWPSMEDLLEQLQQLLVPRRRRWLPLSASVALGSMSVGGGLVYYATVYHATMGQRCTGAGLQLDGIWDDTRRQAVEGAIRGTELRYAPDTWERVEIRLDAYTDAWKRTYTEVCEATAVRHEQSEPAKHLRMRCLDQSRTALRAAVDVLADADAEVVEHAVKLVAGLPALTRCDDLARLEQHDQRVPPPEDPAVAVAVKAQRTRLAEIAATAEAGRYAEALDAIEAAIEQTETLDYPPLWAEALYWRGALRKDDGRYAEAEQDLRKAHALAVRHHHDPVAIDTAVALTYVVGVALARHAEGQQWGEMAALPLAQRSGEPRQEAGLLNNLGVVFHGQGDYAHARAHFERALALHEKTLGPDHPHLAATLNNLGTVFDSLGDLDNARVYYQRALAIRLEGLGPDHPHVALSLNNLGTVFDDLGDYENARVHHQRALAIRLEALSPDHPHLADSLGNLGNLSYRQGDLDNARVYFERALAVWNKALGPDHPQVAATLGNLGAVFHRHGDLDNARAHYQRALDIEDEALGPDHPQLAATLGNLGNVSKSQGDLDRARTYYRRALAIRDKALDPGHPKLAYPLLGLATVALEAGDSASARTYAARAASIREAAMVAPDLLARARFVLAQALWSDKHERARARTLAEQAREAYAEHGQGHEDDLAKVDAWLATHPLH